MSNLTTDESRFQPRQNGVQENHVAHLCDVLKRGEDFDRLSVWEDPQSKELIVADGHHRLEALQRERPDSKLEVDVFHCSYHVALEIPLADNRKNRLSLRYEEKANWAWKLNVEGERSKREVAKICGVSERTVANQRKTMKLLEETDQLLPDNWRDALRLAQGREKDEWTDEDRDAWREAAIAKADEAFGANLTELFRRWPDAAMELVERCAGPDAFADALDYLGWQKSDDDFVDPF
ncbi:hypothetical protein GCM10011363_36440 [Marivita lacus]|uniref:ParB/Sulfiredoxin domain-containing protein n=2 Tax=Marivita lacus TaxID=1323742 RepID=A0ABQ1L3N1_9RHOB|nr:hypothetical protein GCM10011363_36440 [Marivita lacus]